MPPVSLSKACVAPGQGLHILAAIDGTGSRDWRRPDGGNSHIWKFCRDFQPYQFTDPDQRSLLGNDPAQYVKYFDGPNTLGENVDYIGKSVKAWILGLVPKVPAARVSLIGHSRGGHIAIRVARALSQVTFQFLGLYDSVDRTVGPGSEKVPKNVLHARHAVRDPSGHSRFWFGNSGLVAEDGVELKKQYFKATHSAIGGDPWVSEKTRTQDTLLFLGSSLPSLVTVGPDGPMVKPEAVVETLKGAKATMDQVGLAEDTDQSKKADAYIREGARAAGLPI